MFAPSQKVCEVVRKCSRRRQKLARPCRKVRDRSTLLRKVGEIELQRLVFESTDVKTLAGPLKTGSRVGTGDLPSAEGHVALQPQGFESVWTPESTDSAPIIEK